VPNPDLVDGTIFASTGDLLSDLTDWTTELDVVASASDTNDRADWTVTESGVSSGGGGSRLPGYSLWYDASQLTGLTDGQSLSSWPDLSGNLHVMSQGTLANQPTYYSSTAAHLINGHPAVEVAASQFMASASFTALAAPMTFAGVVFLNTVGGSAWLWTNGGSRPFIGTTGAGGYSVITTAGTSTWAGPVQAGTFVMVCSGANTTAIIGNAVFGAAAPPTVAINTGWTASGIGLSGNASNPGRIGELLAYPFQLTLTQAYDLYLYLSAKWGTP
jgi:hypothetical protein